MRLFAALPLGPRLRGFARTSPPPFIIHNSYVPSPSRPAPAGVPALPRQRLGLALARTFELTSGMIFDRQKRLLAFLDALGGDVGALDFQKLLLLYCLEGEPTPTYEFVPYQFGGFSFTSYADKRRLIDQELLVDQEPVWKITPAGRAAARVAPAIRLGMDQFARREAGLRGEALVAASYRRHPYYAIHSKMADRLLAGDSSARVAIHSARPAPGPAGLCTIGYEGRSLEGYLNELLRAGVTLLCDVRRNPLSRKYGFSKGTLARGCRGVGLRYEHLPELGIASDERRDLHTQADYDQLFANYARETLPRETHALSQIQAWIGAGDRVALTCFERLPGQCHRHCVAQALEPALGRRALHL